MTNLKLVSNNGNAPKDSCSVVIDGESFKYDEFVVVGYDPEKGHAIMHSCDAVTMGYAQRLTAYRFALMLRDLSPADKQMVLEVLTEQ